MPKNGHTEEQVVAVLRQVEAGARVDDVCRKVGICKGTYYLWKRKYTGVGVSKLRELRQLRDEVGRLKRLVADLEKASTLLGRALLSLLMEHSGVRETRVNSGRKDLRCPEPLASLVTENGSGPRIGRLQSLACELGRQIRDDTDERRLCCES